MIESSLKRLMINRESQVSAAPPDLTDLVYRELWAVKH